MADQAAAGLRGETQIHLQIRSVIEALHEQGIPATDIRCISCHARLIDLAHITVTPHGPLCPECVKKSTTDYAPAPGVT